MPMSFPEDVNFSAQEISKLYDELSTNLENIPFEELSPRYRMLLKAINDSTELDTNFKLLIKRLLDVSDLGKHYRRNTKSSFDKIAKKGDEMVPRSEPTDPADYDFGTRTSDDFALTGGLTNVNIKENKKMRITKQALTKLIKEELKEVLKEVSIGQDPKGNQGYANDPDMQWWYEQQAYKQAQAQKRAQRDEKMIELQNKLANIQKNTGLSREELGKHPDAKKVMDEMEQLLNQLKSEMDSSKS